MKAIVCTKYGSSDVLKLKEVEKPVSKEDEVLIRIYAASVNSRDWRFMRANPFFIRFGFGFWKPKRQILGADLAGRVEAVGASIKQFRLGDEVFGCLFGDDRSTFAEYACAKENEIALKPGNLSYEEAAAVPLAGMTALQGLRDKGNLQPRQKVLIQGASGGVGSFAVQIAKSFGAEVTAVCSTRNIDMVRSLGADHVIDYKKENFTQNGQHYDLILAVNGYHPISHYLRLLNPGGVYIVSGGSMLQLFQAMRQKNRVPKTGRQKIDVVSLEKSPKDLLVMKDLLESGMVRPLMDASYPLNKTAEALRFYEKVHPKGKIVVTMGYSNGNAQN
jgi:NADPH:quinone reductase-like Zn-dependent oxidoreductase